MIHSDRHKRPTKLHCQNPCCILERGCPPCFSHVTILLPLSSLSPRSTETKCRTGANSSSRKKGLAEPRSLTNTNLILIENTNKIEIELSFLYTLPGSVATARFTQSIGSYRYPYNTTYVIERSSKTQQSTKAGIFQKMDSYSKGA